MRSFCALHIRANPAALGVAKKTRISTKPFKNPVIGCPVTPRANIERKLRRKGEETLALLRNLIPDNQPLDLRIVSRMLLHASLVGLVAGIFGVAFYYALELLQWFFLQKLAGYTVLHAAGEKPIGTADSSHTHFRPWLIVLLPALGGLAAGLLGRRTPEVCGGGGDAIISSFHHQGAMIRKRVIPIKALASLCTLATGGSGGREGPTMQIGGSLGALVGRFLQLPIRERRILLVAGIAAGISAVFRTPLGAALIAVEILYRDGFEADALIPSVFASVVAYSISSSITGESALFLCDRSFPFYPSHLPLYAALALLVSFAAIAFLGIFRISRTLFGKLPGPTWLRPGLGGLLLGLLCLPVVTWISSQTGKTGSGVGLIGGGYGLVQTAISGASWLGTGWYTVALLTGLAIAKMIATSFTIGSGGSAGDFAPSLAIGGLLGGAFGHLAAMLLSDNTIDPGAFALVGMGVFYGSLAHIPLAAVILVCEMAGSYDLLVPLMLAQGVGFVLLRNRSLYETQIIDINRSPAHQASSHADIMSGFRVAQALNAREHVAFHAAVPLAQVSASAKKAGRQAVFPVHNDQNQLIGIIPWATVAATDPDLEIMNWLIAMDIMQSPVTILPQSPLGDAVSLMATHGLRELPVCNEQGHVTGLLTQEDILRFVAQTITPADDHA